MCAPYRNQESLKKLWLRRNYCLCHRIENGQRDSVRDLVWLDQLEGRVVRGLKGMLIVVVIAAIAIVATVEGG